MKTIGLIGGMSWESTVSYYKIVNTVVKERLGGFHSAKCALYSVDFQEIEECQSSGDWQKSAELLSQAAISLKQAGADFIVICTNTMHKVANEVEAATGLPLLHIAEATANKLLEEKINCVALLGTKYTMEEDFYKAKLLEKGLDVRIPNEEQRNRINDVIYHELCLGVLNEESRAYFLAVIEELAQQGAQGVILGCTEIGLLVSQADTAVPLFDTAQIHAQQAALYALD